MIFSKNVQKNSKKIGKFLKLFLKFSIWAKVPYMHLCINCPHISTVKLIGKK